MPGRQGPAARARERSSSQLHAVGRELRTARLQAGLRQADVAGRAGLLRSEISRIERGLVRSPSIEKVSVLCATVGLDLSIRVYPAGDPLRDAAHLALLERFHRRLDARVRWRTEVPLPIPGDRRAWDAMLTVTGRSVGVEAETRPRDLQEAERRIALKMRDANVDTVILVLADTRANRLLVRAHAGRLAASFPIPGRQALDLLGAGEHPGGSALVLI